MRAPLVKGLFLFFLFAGACRDKKGEGDQPGFYAKKLPEPTAWSETEKADSIPAYDGYLAAFPSGPHADEARQALRGLWDEKLKTMDIADLQKLTAVIETSQGTIKFKFFPEAAPQTVRNFIKLAQSHFYDGLTFHRVIDGYLIQGGCPKGDGTGGPGYELPAEFNDHPHLEGTVAMARGLNPNSGGSQFYICLSPQPRLDGHYTVFGQVTEGLDVAQAIGKSPTDAKDYPLTPPVMKRVYILGFSGGTK